MRRALLTAGAVLILSVPAFAQDVTIEKTTTTITKEVPESGSTVSTVRRAEPAAGAARAFSE